MPIRTVQIQGQGYGSTSAQITVTANANTVFSGTVNTVDQPVPSLPNADIDLSNVLCTFEIDTAFTGQIPMTCQVFSGTVIFADILANYYGRIPNPVYTPEQIAILNDPATPQADRVAIFTQVAVPALSQAEIDLLLDPATPLSEAKAITAAHSCQATIPSGPDLYRPIDVSDDPRSSVVIDGIAQTPDHSELPGAWWWTITSGSTLAYELNVDPGVV